MTKVFASIFLLSLLTTSVHAQQFPVQGSIKDSTTQEALIGVTLTLTHQNDSSFKKLNITDIEGNFTFSGIAPGGYELTATYVGYANKTRAVQVNDQSVQLGNIYLTPNTQFLEGVVIEGELLQTVQLGDTTQFNADAFKTAPDASAQDLVEKMPGIVMQDGKIQAQGEDVQQILIDGKPFFGTDVNAALQSLPSEVIASIQVFDKLSDKAELSGFDDGERIKTINIITKPNRRKGQFGKLSAGYGTNDRYLLGASINLFNDDRRITVTGLSNNINTLNFSADPNNQGESRTQNGIIKTNALGLNISDEWGENMEVSGSYFFNRRQFQGNQERVRDFVLPTDSGQVYTEDSYNNNINTDHRFNMRFDYDINERNRLLIRPNVSLKHNDNNNYFLGRTNTDNGPLNQTENTSSANNLDYDIDNRIYYSHRFSKPGRTFMVNVNTGYHTNDNESYQYADNFFYESEDNNKILDQYSTLDRTGFSWESNASYTEPVGKNGQAEIEYKVGNRINDSDKLTYDFIEETGGYNRLDTALSNTFNNNYVTQEAEIGYQYQKEKLKVQVEGEYQLATLQNEQIFPRAFDMERTFESILPSVRIDYELSESKSIEFNYRTWTNAPSIDQLQDVIDNSNPLQLRTGNPDLDQSYQSWIRARYRTNNPETNRSLYASISSSFVKDYITNGTFIADAPIELNDGLVLEKGSQLTQPVNVDGYWNFSSYFSYGQPIDLIKSNFNVRGGVNYSERPGLINEEVNQANSSNFRLGVSLSSNISEKIDFNISTRSSYNIVENSLRPALNNNYFNQTTRLSYQWILWEGFVYRTNLNHEVNSGLSAGYDNNFLLLNMSIGKKMFKDQQGEISLNVYDLLKQNNNIRRNITDLYIEDVQSAVLQRYFMLTLTYNIRHFSGGSIDDFEDIYRN